MLKSVRKTMFFVFIFTSLLLMLVSPAVKAEGFNLPKAPLAPGHNIYFQALGLPDGVLFTIAGTRINNGGHATAYTTSFTTPDMSPGIGADPDSEFTYNGFPATVTVGNQDYQLLSLIPTSPLIVGSSGGLTTVIATYEATCTAPSITGDPVAQAVLYGDPVSFTVSATGAPPLTYQWYKDGNQIPNADQSTYSIPFALMSDAGMHHAVITNSCGNASSSQAQLTVNKANQAITFDQPTSPAVYGSTFTVTPTVSSGLQVYLGASGSCINSGYEVSMVSGTGDCVLVASQPGDDNYNPAGDVVRIVAAAKSDQSITFPEPASPAEYGTIFSVTLSTDSGLPVKLIASGGCSNNGTEVTMTSGSLTCNLTASQLGDDNYNPALDVVHTVEAMKANQAIDFIQPNTPAIYGSSFEVSAVSDVGLPVSIGTEGSCTNNVFNVTMVSGTGQCVLTASQDGNDNYAPAAEVMRVVEAAKASQTITFEQPPSPVKYKTSFTVAPVSSSYLPVTLAVSGSCSSSGYTVSMIKTSGTCVLTSSQAGDNDYLPAEVVERTVVVAPNGNVIYIPLLFGR